MKNNNQQQTTDYDPYQPDNIELFAAIYGKNLISLGGIAAIDNMFSDLDLSGLKILDLGFGLGGVAFYLAEKYKIKLSAIELDSWMVEYATAHIPENLSDKLEFNTYNSKGEFPYRSESFDLVYSKGVLNHVADKASLFKQVNKVLKPEGLFVIADWVFPEIKIDSSAPLVCETKESYEQVLINTGFYDINFRDDSLAFIKYIKELLQNLGKNQELIKQKYGEKLYRDIQEQHEELMEKISSKQQIAVRILAKKSK